MNNRGGQRQAGRQKEQPVEVSGHRTRRESETIGGRVAREQREVGPGEGLDAELPAPASKPLGLRLLHRVP